MVKIMNVFLLVVCSGMLLSCSEESTGPVSPLPQSEFAKVDSRLLLANNTFGFNLFRAMHQEDGEANIFMSPISVSMALGMTMNGAKGETKSAMAETLEMQGLTQQEINSNYRLVLDLLPTLDGGVDIAIANSIWSTIGFSVLPEFLKVNEDYFDATTQELDFTSEKAPEIINGWVYDHTNGKVESIVPDPIPRDAVMYLINVVYFKAPWTVTFDKDETLALPFYSFDGTSIDIDMMRRGDTIPYHSTSTFAAADLRYGNGAYAMTVILPNKSGTQAMANVIEGLNNATWQELTADLSDEAVVLQMPKFTVKYELKMNDVLKAMGMGIALQPGGADFGGISSDGGLFISEVKHKTFIEVSEEGTEAAAATSVEIGRTTSNDGPKIYSMVLNRPFLYVIRERETGSILFMGIYQVPE